MISLLSPQARQRNLYSISFNRIYGGWWACIRSVLTTASCPHGHLRRNHMPGKKSRTRTCHRGPRITVSHSSDFSISHQTRLSNRIRMYARFVNQHKNKIRTFKVLKPSALQKCRSPVAIPFLCIIRDLAWRGAFRAASAVGCLFRFALVFSSLTLRLFDMAIRNPAPRAQGHVA